MRLVPLLCLLISCVAHAADAPLPLVLNGRPAVRIVSHSGISRSEQTAVKELQAFIAEMSGAKLPAFAAPNPAGFGYRIPSIVVGQKTARALYPDLDLANLGTDGFVIKRIDNALILAGGEQRGTLYAVYSLLESLGCRWWTPTESTIPKALTIQVGSPDIREVPRLEYRDLMYAELWQAPAGQIWRARNRVNGFMGSSIPEEYGGNVRFETSLVHSYGPLLRSVPSLDYANRQELWALYKGQRNAQQPCLTHPQVVAAMIQAVRQRLRARPGDAFVTVGQNDGSVYCQCPTCAELTVKHGSPAALVINLANRVAEDVRKDFPSARIMASAYDWSRKPPRDLPPRDNVMIALAPIEADFGHPLASGVSERNVAIVADLEGWSRIAKTIYIWDYATNFDQFLAPFPNLDVLAPNIKYYVEHGVAGYFVQGAHTCRGAEFSPLRMWVLAHGMWNPGADNTALIREFLRGYYGAAAMPIAQYIDLMHGSVRQDPRAPVRCYGYLEKAEQAWINPRTLAAAEALLRDAEAKVRGDANLERRVRHAHLPLWYVLARRGPSSLIWREVEKTAGPISPRSLAANLKLALSENRVTKLEENDRGRFALFGAWLEDWSARSGDGPDALPPELKDADPASYRLVHAFNTLFPPRWHGRDATASDGHVVVVQSHQWLMQYPLREDDDFASRQRYTLFVRVKAPKVEKEGVAFSAGLHHKDGPLQKSIPTDRITAGQWQTFEIGSAAPKPGQTFWLALTADRNVPEVILDCFWLRPDPRQ